MEPTERQLMALMLKSMGFKLGEIAEVMGTSKQNVHSMIKRGLKNVEKYDTMNKLLKASIAASILFFKPGEKLIDVAYKLLEEADRLSIKLRGNEQDLASCVKLEVDNDGRTILEPVAIGICRNGKIVILTKNALEQFTRLKLEIDKLVSVYSKGKNSADLSSQ